MQPTRRLQTIYPLYSSVSSVVNSSPCPPCEVLTMKLSGFFGITNHGDFSSDGIRNAMNNLFKLPRHIVAERSLAALTANRGRNIFNHNNTAAHIGGKGREFFPYRSFAHKTRHGFLLCLKSTDHSAGLGKYAVTSHNSVPFEPHTTCRGRPAAVRPSTKQLGKG